jgi:TonB family protein
MRHTWLQFVIAVVLFPVAPAQQPPNSSPSTLQFENGTIAKDIYTNECLGFSFAIPSGWEVNTQAIGADGKAKHLPGGGLALIVLDQGKEKPSGNKIVLTALDANGSGSTAKQFVSNSVHRQIEVNREHRELIQDAFPVVFAGKHFFRADYKQSSTTGGPLYLALVYTKFRGYFLGETLIAGSAKELDESANSLQGVSFQEDAPNSKCTMAAENGPSSTGAVGGVIGSVAQPPGPGQPQRVRVSQGVAQGLLIRKVQPQYPADARQGHIQGVVVLKALLDTNGDVEDLTLVSGHPLLAPAAIEAVKQWKYKPYLLNGQPVKVETQITVSFQLSTY